MSTPKNPFPNRARQIRDLRARAADQIEEIGAVLTHLREAAEWAKRNPRGAAQDLADAGAVLINLHDACGNLSKVAFDLAKALTT